MITDLDLYTIDYQLIHNYEKDILEKNHILPIQEYDIFILIASCGEDIDNPFVEMIFTKPIKMIHIEKKVFDFEILHLEAKYTLYKKALQSLQNKEDFNIHESQISYFIEELFKIAISLNSSDIHIESLKNTLLIRLRIDGILVQFFRFGIELYPIVRSTLKLFSKLDISQKRVPQNGRFSKSIAHKK